MALVQGNTVTATATGVSNHIKLHDTGHYIVRCTSAGAFLLDIQEGPLDGSSFADAYASASDKATVDSTSGPRSYIVPGGIAIRMDVGTYNSAITMTATKIREARG